MELDWPHQECSGGDGLSSVVAKETKEERENRGEGVES